MAKAFSSITLTQPELVAAVKVLLSEQDDDRSDQNLKLV
jgi:hypothetical protein